MVLHLINKSLPHALHCSGSVGYISSKTERLSRPAFERLIVNCHSLSFAEYSNSLEGMCHLGVFGEIVAQLGYWHLIPGFRAFASYWFGSFLSQVQAYGSAWCRVSTQCRALPASSTVFLPGPSIWLPWALCLGRVQ